MADWVTKAGSVAGKGRRRQVLSLHRPANGGRREGEQSRGGQREARYGDMAADGDREHGANIFKIKLQ